MLILLFSYHSFAKLLESLEEEYKVRTPYLAYLVNAHQGLLATHAHLERLIERVERYMTLYYEPWYPYNNTKKFFSTLYYYKEEMQLMLIFPGR